jgi:hypothetical protein
MKPRKPLKRYKPVRKKRPGIRRGELTAQEKEAKRAFIYELSGGMCELKLPNCKGGFLPWDGSIFERWHLVHMRAKRRFGWPTEGEHRMRGGCHNCHILQMHSKGLKPADLEESK